MIRLAWSLVTLRNEANALAPKRSKASDGWLGDAAHQSRASRHNPNAEGVVTALDLTHDPRGGFDAHAAAERLRRDPHPELAYLISRGRFAGRSTGWRWHVYTGSNQHNAHIHVAVGVGPDADPERPYDSRSTWGIRAQSSPVLSEGSTGERVRAVQTITNAAGCNAGKVDGIYGPRTSEAVKCWQRKLKLTADGLWGPKTQQATDAFFRWLVAQPKRPTLRRGSSGDHVRYLQRRLKVRADGIFGPKTESAVRSFQRSKRLKVDGIVGPKTWKALG